METKKYNLIKVFGLGYTGVNTHYHLQELVDADRINDEATHFDVNFKKTLLKLYIIDIIL